MYVFLINLKTTQSCQLILFYYYLLLFGYRYKLLLRTDIFPIILWYFWIFILKHNLSIQFFIKSCSSSNLQNHLAYMENWFTIWRFKVNQSKSIHTTFTLRQAPCPNVSLYGTPIPTSPTIKYLGLTLDQRLTWAHHIRTNRLALNNRLRMLKTVLCNNKYTSTCIKLLIYKSLLKPM